MITIASAGAAAVTESVMVTITLPIATTTVPTLRRRLLLEPLVLFLDISQKIFTQLFRRLDIVCLRAPAAELVSSITQYLL